MPAENAAAPPLQPTAAGSPSTADLYRAALGPWRSAHYLQAFARFDAAGSASLGWNPVAALFTLGWLVYRRLWIGALAYVGIVVFAALVLLGIGRLVFQLSPEVQWALGGLGCLLTVLVPGLLGDAWLYAACNRQISTTLAASATDQDAVARLQAQAPGTRRLAVLGALYVLLAALVLAAWPTGDGLHGSKALEARGVVTPAEPAAQAASAASASASAAPPASSPASAAAATTDASAPAAPFASSATPALPAAATTAASTSASAAASTSAPAAAPAPSASAVHRATATETRKERLARAKERKKAAAAARAAAASEAAEPTATDTQAHAAKHSGPRSAKHAKSAASQAAQRAEPPANASGADLPYLINVGLFADENNARNAYARLQDAGLPALLQPVKSSKGPRSRVRVGPFATEAEAERAADTVRSLQLEAQIFKP